MEQLLEKAIQLATQWHDGQVDKSGKPYIEHPLRVMSFVEPIDCKIIAVLHDVIEDCEVSPGDLVDHGIPQELVTCVTLLSKRKKEPYMEYIDRVGRDERTRLVKLADLKDNMDLTRLYPSIDISKLEDDVYLEAALAEKDLKRYKKYQRAKAQLESVHAYHMKQKNK